MRFTGRAASVVVGLALAVLVLLLGRAAQKPVRCRFGNEHTVVRTESRLFEGLSLAVRGSDAVALWSTSAGFFGRPLKPDGRPKGPPIRIGSRCRGGLNSWVGDDVLWVACLRQNRGDVDDAGGVTVYLLDPSLRPMSSTHFGTAGSMSRGVGMARGERGILVVWHDARPEAQRVWLAETDGVSALESRVISRDGRLAGPPSILRFGDRVWTAWAETWMESEKLRGEILLAKGGAAPRVVMEVSYPSATPQLIALDGRVLLAFREQPDRDRPPGLYLAWLGPSGAMAGKAVRMARADAEDRPALSSCFGGLVAASPRTYGVDRFVGVNWVDVSLIRRVGEQQFCEATRQFSLAASVCTGPNALVLIAEIGSSFHEDIRLRSVPFGCR